MGMGHGKLSEKEKTHCYKEGLCLYYREKGNCHATCYVHSQRQSSAQVSVQVTKLFVIIKNSHFLSDYSGVHVKLWLFSHTHWHWDSWKLHGWESSQVIIHSRGSSEQFTEYSCSELDPRRKGNEMVTMPTGILHSETIKSLTHLLLPLNKPSKKNPATSPDSNFC